MTDLGNAWDYWPVGVVAAAAAIGTLKVWMHKWRAASWPTTQGTVMSAGARTAMDERGIVGELAYSYQVAGDYYSGFHHLQAGTEDEAEFRVAGWNGRTVVVRYDPGDPSKSLLLKGDQPGSQLGN
ncbi:MAG TPA: DUF3592 domain-containing protein [Terriglobales bacterium]|jgi:hypothetical protein